MHEQTDQDRPIETIEEMPAAPEADPGTRDADAPTWSAPTEGHTEPPLTAPAAAPAAPETSPAPTPEVISADRVEVNQGGAGRIEGREITVNQGGAGLIRGDQVKIDQGGAGVVIARRVTMRQGSAFLVLARRVDGDVRVAFDWRALTALFIGIVAVLVARGRR